MNLVLFDYPKYRSQLLPLTFTRPVCDIRIGILTIREKWEKELNLKSQTLTSDYLSKKYNHDGDGLKIYLNSSFTPNTELLGIIKSLNVNQGIITDQGVLVALKTDLFFATLEKLLTHSTIDQLTYASEALEFPWQIFQRNEQELKADFTLLTAGRKSQKLSDSNQLIGELSQLFIEEGAKIECSNLNTKTGQIYIGVDAEIMEGSAIRGPFALCEHSQVKLSTKIYGATTIGPHCKVGGEINNSVIFGYTNKAHDGFLGNSVIGEWCNLGADTNSSNLKNNYADVMIFSYHDNKAISTGSQFCGLIMGDHSKSGINTMFNTGTVVGVCANIFGGGFPPTYIPSFSWGGAEGLTEFRIDKAFEIAALVMERRGIKLSQEDKNILTHINEHSVHSKS